MNKQRVQTVKFNSTTMVQEIVAVLKSPPFNQTMTLITFEEKKEYELLELILTSMEMIDKNLKIDKNNTAESLKAVFDFLKIISFPYTSDHQLQNDLAKGDKRLLIQILHFIFKV